MKRSRHFDVFLCHNRKDKLAVRELDEKLRARGLKVWLDERELIPGRPWQESLEKIIHTTKSAAVLVGADGGGPWQQRELHGCLSEFVERDLPVIPVLLRNAPRKPDLPLFLKLLTWVDFRGVGLTKEGLALLEWGITGKAPIQKTLSPAEHRAVQAEAMQVADALSAAVVKSVETAEFAIKNSHMYPEAQTDPGKINPNDTSKHVDLVCGEIIEEVLNQVSKDAGHVLSEGFYYIPEERSATWVQGLTTGSAKKRVIVADEADDTPAFITRLGGTVLLACYRIGFGWIAAAVGDFARRRLYTRIFEKNSSAIQLEYPNPHRILYPDLCVPAVIPSGVLLPISPTTTKSLKNAAVNIYLGKSARVLDTARLGAQLLRKGNIGSIHSHGGSLGPILVAEGSLDASVEFVKGFKRIDLIPGLFVAQGAGAKVFELTSEYELIEFRFGIDFQLESILNSQETSELVDLARQRFVVAATAELAEEIATMLRRKKTR